MAKKATSLKYQPKPYRGRARKEQTVSKWSDKVEKAQGLVFTNYQGMTHHQLEIVKKAAKKLDSDFVVTKNRLMLRALESRNLSDEEKKQFQNPTATLFIYGDYIEPIKALAKTMKELSLPTVKFGFVEGKPMNAQDIAKLATLPGMQELRAQLAFTLNSPIQGLHRALQWNIQTFVMTLSSIASKKQQ